jgi:hypothetical protein
MKKYDSEFERLARTLEPNERKSLLDKIRKLKQIENIKIPEVKKENIVRRQLNYAKNLVVKSNFITKIIVWFISFFSNKKREEVILGWMFNDIKKEITIKYGNLVDFKNGVLTRYFAEEVLNLAEICNELIPIINLYFKDEVYYYDFLSLLIEKSFSSELQMSLDKLNPETFNLDSDYIELDKYFSERDKRLKDFFQKLSFYSFNNIEKFFSRFELIIIMVNFDYKGLLYDFIREDQLGRNQSKEGIHFFIVENLLERLYILLETINFNYDQIIPIEDMLHFSKDQMENATDESIFSKKDIEKIKMLLQSINNFKKAVPLKLIFQYFKNDILYSPTPLSIKIDVLTLYKEYKRKIINKEWTIYFEKIGEMNLKKTLDLLFPEYDFNTLDYFNPDLSEIINKKSPFKLKNVKKINIIMHFLDTKYRTEIEKIINKILISGNFTKDTIRSNLASTYYLLHNYPERIRNFDNDFESDNEYGRKISSYLKVSSGEIDYTRTLRNTILDINDSSNQLIEEVFNALWSIQELANNLANYYNAKNVLVLNFNEIKLPGYFNSIQAIKDVKKILDLFFKVYNQIGEY